MKYNFNGYYNFLYGAEIRFRQKLGGINMNVISLNKWFDVNNTKYKVHSIQKSVDGKHYDLVLFKDLSYLGMKNKFARLEIYYSPTSQDYVVAWAGYDHGFTGELLDLCVKLINRLNTNLYAKDDGLERIGI